MSSIPAPARDDDAAPSIPSGPPSCGLPDILPMRPEPLVTQVAYIETPAETYTAIGRGWREGDPERCDKCPECTAEKGFCLVVVIGHVPEASCRMFALGDLPERRG